jgi:hypothetical protein
LFSLFLVEFKPSELKLIDFIWKLSKKCLSFF